MQPVTPLFVNGVASGTLRTLLSLTGVSVTDYSVASVMQCTQASWRKHDVQSGNIIDAYASDQSAFRPHLQKLGALGEVLPRLTKYAYGAVGGAFLLAIRKRIAFLCKMWNAGVRFDHVVFLGSKRPPDPVKETLQAINTPSKGVLEFSLDWQPLRTLPENEAAIMDHVWMQSALPTELAQLPLTIVETPLRTEGEKRDPGLADTLAYWKAAHRPAPGSFMLVYSQPSILHARSIIDVILGTEYPTDVVGYDPSDPLTLNVSQALDSLAKVIFEYPQGI